MVATESAIQTKAVMSSYIVPPNSDIIEHGCNVLRYFPTIWEVMTEYEREELTRTALLAQKRLQAAMDLGLEDVS